MATHQQGFIAAPRGDAGLRLIQSGKKGSGANAFLLLYIIANRCRYTEKGDGLKRGQCYISTEMKPLSRRQTRTAITILKSANQIATQSTSMGTVVTLISTDIFDIYGKDKATQSTSETTRNRPEIDQPSDQKSTTNEQGKKDFNKETFTDAEKSKLNFPEDQKRTEVQI